MLNFYPSYTTPEVKPSYFYVILLPYILIEWVSVIYELVTRVSQLKMKNVCTLKVIYSQ